MVSRRTSNSAHLGQTQSNEHSKLVIKNQRPGRKSLSVIHCIPKFSKVLPTKHMSEAQKALQKKIRKKAIGAPLPTSESESNRTIDNSDMVFNSFSREINSKQTISAELSIEPVTKNKSKIQRYDRQHHEPEITIIPKYPHLLSQQQPLGVRLLNDPNGGHASGNEKEKEIIPQRAKSHIFIIKKDDFEKLLPTNPTLFSSYIFLPSMNCFVHPFLLPYHQLIPAILNQT